MNEFNKLDEKLMDLMTQIAINNGYELCSNWRGFQCNQYYKSIRGIELFFNGEVSLPEIRTPRGEYSFGSYGYKSNNLKKPFLVWIEDTFDTRIIRSYDIPDDELHGFKYQFLQRGPVIFISEDNIKKVLTEI